MGETFSPDAANKIGELPKVLIQLPEGGVSLVDVEKELVRQAMQRAGSNQTRAAKLLGLERDALRRRLIKFGLMHAEVSQTVEGGAHI